MHSLSILHRSFPPQENAVNNSIIIMWRKTHRIWIKRLCFTSTISEIFTERVWSSGFLVMWMDFFFASVCRVYSISETVCQSVSIAKKGKNISLHLEKKTKFKIFVDWCYFCCYCLLKSYYSCACILVSMDCVEMTSSVIARIFPMFDRLIAKFTLLLYSMFVWDKNQQNKWGW